MTAVSAHWLKCWTPSEWPCQCVRVYRDDLTNICPVQPDWTDDSTVCLQPPPCRCPDKPNLTFKGAIRWIQRGQKRETEISYMLVLHVCVYKYSLCTHINVVCGFCFAKVSIINIYCIYLALVVWTLTLQTWNPKVCYYFSFLGTFQLEDLLMRAGRSATYC